MSNKERGLYPKYYVQKIVGNDLLEVNDFVFVLNPKTDPIAAGALEFYADQADAAGYTELAEDLWKLLDEL